MLTISDDFVSSGGKFIYRNQSDQRGEGYHGTRRRNRYRYRNSGLDAVIFLLNLFIYKGLPSSRINQNFIGQDIHLQI